MIDGARSLEGAVYSAVGGDERVLGHQPDHGRVARAVVHLAEPLNTDEIMAASRFRGNASMNIRQLVNWGLVNRVHKKGDRKEYFGVQTDVWEMFETIVRERRRREVEPIIETISRCRQIVADNLRRSATSSGTRPRCTANGWTTCRSSYADQRVGERAAG